MTKPQTTGQSRRGKRPVPDTERFLALTLPEPNSGCLLWDGTWKYSGTNDSQIRGRFSLNGRVVTAHRAAWELYCGAVPAGMGVLHRCDVPLCVNPAHLFLGNQASNVADAIAKNRWRHEQKGEQHGMAKLTDAAAAQIRASSKASPALAAEYGLSRSTIHRIRTNRSWRHI